MAEEAQYSVQKLARIAGVSVRQLERYFATEKLERPRDWLNRLRQTKARQLLSCGQTVKEVAYALGYKQPAHFSREFKRYHKVPPVNYSQPSTPCREEITDVGNRHEHSLPMVNASG